MKIVVTLFCTALLGAAIWLANDVIAPLFLNSRIERLGEKDLPKIRIEKNGAVYCRMKADDFRFPLPPGSIGSNPIVTGTFDCVDGTVECRFPGSNQLSAADYQSWVSGKVPVGGHVTAEALPEGLLIKFHYFGDK